MIHSNGSIKEKLEMKDGKVSGKNRDRKTAHTHKHTRTPLRNKMRKEDQKQ